MPSLAALKVLLQEFIRRVSGEPIPGSANG
jgi:hypothetical protein